MSKPTKSPALHPKLMLFGNPRGDFRFLISIVQRYVPEAVPPGEAS